MNKVYFNPDYYIKWDQFRAILFSKYECSNGGKKNWASYIHPLHALIFALFSQEHDIEKNILYISSISGLQEESIQHFISSLIEKPESCTIYLADDYFVIPKNIFILKRTDHLQNNLTKIIDECLKVQKVDFKTKRDFVSPLSFTWMINNKCTVDCTYCYADTVTKTNEVDLNIFEKVIKESYELNIQKIDLIGGDFFVKKEWWKYLKLLIDYRFSPEFLSTKKPLSNDEIILLNSLNYKGVLQFSIDSLNPNTLRKMIHNGDSYLKKFHNMIKSISSLAKNNISFLFRISTVITRHNYEENEINNLRKYFRELNFVC